MNENTQNYFIPSQTTGPSNSMLPTLIGNHTDPEAQKGAFSDPLIQDPSDMFFIQNMTNWLSTEARAAGSQPNDSICSFKTAFLYMAN